MIKLTLIVALLVQPERPAFTTVLADQFVAANRCTARWSWGETFLGLGVPNPTGETHVLRCRVPPIPDPIEMVGKWYLQDHLDKKVWWIQGSTPGSWVRFAGEP